MFACCTVVLIARIIKLTVWEVFIAASDRPVAHTWTPALKTQNWRPTLMKWKPIYMQIIWDTIIIWFTGPVTEVRDVTSLFTCFMRRYAGFAHDFNYIHLFNLKIRQKHTNRCLWRPSGYFWRLQRLFC